MNIVSCIRENGSKRVVYVNDEPSLTRQSMSDECDINLIMAKFEKTGLLTHVNEFQGDYGDYTNVQPYDESLRQVMAAQDAFMSLPAQVRAKFENDPGQFLDFVGDPTNAQAMVDMGLCNAPVAATDAAPHNSSLDVIVGTDTSES